MYYPGEWRSITSVTTAVAPFQLAESRLITSSQWLEKMDLQPGTHTSNECSVIKKVFRFFANLATKLKHNKKKVNDY